MLFLDATAAAAAVAIYNRIYIRTICHHHKEINTVNRCDAMMTI
jgi:hypothetical protein